ncbi:GerAB/ArcD/ProY family transporter [Lederbergia wuyishanensis]|uniref:Spore germination protein (Amino acid permease) n=1 Tax=Lederbergia wuyishanensis TaxID=1347903 RepID=A0ABU0D8Q8_9BACI|nr:GerAB/ArcD/ProY family transporter [Lederbergia wuyishanensis]MCJ8007658.1 spore germination protein [Lederbergia wuyishanensis]MDQ0344758.1 spore germination protein (amino acid permease) [Lederbergia wuyishanensis]
MKSKQHISPFQLILVLIHAQIGVGIVSLPYDMFNKSNGDSWISVLITGVILQVMILLIWILMSRFPNKNFFEMLQTLFGKFFGKFITILYSGYFNFVAGMVLAKYGYAIKVWMLPLTPKWLLLVLMIVTAIYIVKENLRILTRFFLLASFTLIVFIALSAYSLKFSNITYILPIGSHGIQKIINGISAGFPSFQGFELLMLLFPFVRADRKSVLKAATIANVFVTIFYTFIVLTCLLFFNPRELKLVPEPVLYLIKSFSFKIIERPDLIFTSMWIVLVATTLMSLLFVSSIGLSFVMNTKSHKYFAYITAFACFLIALIPQGKFEIEALGKINHKLVVFFAFVFPIIFLLISIIFKKKERSDSK